MADNKNIEEAKEVKKKKCFIITPIGEENTPIRRHIDGIINACIEPVLKEKGYDMEVSHRVSTPGSINNRILTSIYSYDLAIANLTKLNPNVMYELAFRHSVNKPVIMIMKKDSERLPFDINGERTIFYTDDSQGTIELRKALRDVIDAIEINKDGVIGNPIYNAIKDIKESNNVLESIEKEADKTIPQQTDTLKFILNKITNIENTLNRNVNNNQIIKSASTFISDFFVEIPTITKSKGLLQIISQLKQKKTMNLVIYSAEIRNKGIVLKVGHNCSKDETDEIISEILRIVFEDLNIGNILFSVQCITSVAIG